MITREEFSNNFKLFVSSMESTLIAKNDDYTAKSLDPLYNFKKSEAIGVPAYKGAMLRFLDKVSRLETFLKKGIFEVKDESFEDTIKDAANYLFLINELYKEAQNEANKIVNNSSRFENVIRTEIITNNEDIKQV